MNLNRFTHYLTIALLLLTISVAAVGDSNFTNVVASGDITAGDDVTITDDVTVGGDLDLTGDLAVTGTTEFSDAITQDVGIENVGVLPTVIKYTVTYTEATYNVAVKAANEVWYVHDVFVQVTDDYDVTGDDATFLVGDAGDTDGYCVLADAELQATDTEYTGAVASWQCLTSATVGVYLDEDSSHIVSGALYTITATVLETTGATGTAGTADVYVVYTRLE